jgi:hypothetical protein
MLNRLSSLILLLLGLLLLPGSARAQTDGNGGGSATIGVPITDAFPVIEFYLDVHDSQGEFVHDLKAEQVFILEDGMVLAPSVVEEMRPGVQFVVAINPGSSFGIRNARAVSRYDLIKQALREWAQSRQGSTLDDWSLLITGGATASHASNPSEWLATLDTDQVDARSATPSLDTLFRALTLASDPAVRSGMGRAVLFITPPPEGETEQAMENLAAQAQAQQVAINIWMVASSGAFSARSVEQLTQLAAQTGGEFLTFSGEETLPNPDSYLEPLRFIYRVAYQSSISGSGAHQISVQVQIETQKIESNVQDFMINVEPPQPAFVSPPIVIQRSLVSGENTTDEDGPTVTELLPKSQPLQVVFDFPDGRMRPLVQTFLLVDGVVVAENRQAPFDQFTWDIDGYTTSGTHRLQVQAVDTLGMVGSSIEVPVQISVESIESNPWALFQRNITVLSALAILLAGAVLLLVLVLGGRLHPQSLRASRKRKRKSDPVTQPVPIKNEPAARRLPGWVNRLQWPQRHAAPKADAFLAYVPETEDRPTAPPIPIASEEVTLGNDPKQATLVFDDPSIEALHARLIRQPDGSFRILDAGSIAGTWVNYAPISREGTKLEHGDLIHIGRLGFRFTLRQPAQVRKPTITLTAAQASTKESADDSS